MSIFEVFFDVALTFLIETEAVFIIEEKRDDVIRLLKVHWNYIFCSVMMPRDCYVEGGESNANVSGWLADLNKDA